MQIRQSVRNSFSLSSQQKVGPAPWILHNPTSILKQINKRTSESGKEDQISEGKKKEGGAVQWDSQKTNFNMRVVLHSRSPQERPFTSREKRSSSDPIARRQDEKRKVYVAGTHIE